MIQLVGPGGAGKTTIGAALAARLCVRFVDLDAEFAARHGNISAYLDANGYETYAEQNVGLYSDLVGGPVRLDVVALSSGFMTYPDRIHPDYLAVRQRVASSPSTFVLLPSVDFEACVGEIVRRQCGRPFARSAEREEQVIRERFSLYLGLPARKVQTMQPVEAVVVDLITALAAQHALHQTAAAGHVSGRW
jgi:shikimate kinase